MSLKMPLFWKWKYQAPMKKKTSPFLIFFLFSLSRYSISQSPCVLREHLPVSTSIITTM